MADQTTYQVLNKMSEIALSGVNECFIGDAWEIEAVARKYPLMVLDNNLKNHTWQAGVINMRLDIYIMDLVNADESNELEVLSDMTNVGIQYVNHLTDHLPDYNFYIRKNNQQTITFQTFTEKFDDKVSGVRFEVTVSIPDDGNQCESIFNI
jgi:hypothetical protein